MIQEILQWYNLIFYVSIFLGVVFISSSVMGIEAETDIGIDADVDVEAAIDPDNLEIELDGHDGLFAKILGVFGIGKCPLSIVLFTAFLLFGITGLVLNIFFAPWLAILSVVGAFCVTLIGTRFIALTVSAFMPQTETYNITPHHFVGKRGSVVISVTETFGQIHIRDGYGSLHKLNARSYGDKYPISTGVLVTEFKNGIYYVDKPKEEIL